MDDSESVGPWAWDQQRFPYNRTVAEYLAERDQGKTILAWPAWQEQHRYHGEMIRWEAEQRKNELARWEEYVEAEEASFRSSLPPNWNAPDVEFPALDELENLQLREGLPLAWVPPNHVLREVLTSRTPAGRRSVIANQSDAIIKSCLSELRRLRSTQTAEWARSARQAALAMRAGHWRAGQALAAITLDTATDKFVRSSYPAATRHSRGGKGRVKIATPPGSSDDSLPAWQDADYPRAMLVLHSIYGAFAEFSPQSGELVPIQFSRHGTVHTISRRQYSKANSLIALMHVVGLLCLVEDN